MDDFFRKKNLHNFTVRNLPKQNLYKQFAEIGSNLFILEIWKRLSCGEFCS